MVKGVKFYNNGAEGGTGVGDRFDVYALGEELIDPDTGIPFSYEEERFYSDKITSVDLPLFVGPPLECPLKTVPEC